MTKDLWVSLAQKVHLDLLEMEGHQDFQEHQEPQVLQGSEVILDSSDFQA